MTPITAELNYVSDAVNLTDDTAVAYIGGSGAQPNPNPFIQTSLDIQVLKTLTHAQQKKIAQE